MWLILYGHEAVRHNGPSINDVGSLEGVGGCKLLIWVDMMGGGVKKIDIGNSRLAYLDFFRENVKNCLLWMAL